MNAQATIKLHTPDEALALLGENDQNLKRLRERLNAKIIARGDTVTISGESQDVEQAERLMRDLLALVRQGASVNLEEIDRSHNVTLNGGSLAEDTALESNITELPKRFRPKTKGQREYIEAIAENEIVFGVGPAGTGKTFLAVAMAVAAFKAKRVKRIVLTRPAVEAGERLGFLPGDLQAKIDPYLRPLYDAISDMIDVERFESYLASGLIEVAPLAFMRGRAQPLHCQVLTPLGWRKMGQLEFGDMVMGKNGRPTQVLGVYPQGSKETYRITMSDGSQTECCAEHLWHVFTASDKRRNKDGRVLELREMMGNLKTHHQQRYEIPMMEAVEFPSQSTPMEPYALGLLLGDGCLTGKTTPSFASNDPELVDALEVAMPGIQAKQTGPADYVLRNKNGSRGGLRVANPVTATLRELDLCGTTSHNKFIPDAYKYNTVAVRTALLQGLLDSDGGPVTQHSRSCRIQYTTVSAQLREDMIWLVQSLGGIAHTRTRKAEGRTPGFAQGRQVFHRHDAYILEIRLPPNIAPFRLRRKLEKYNAKPPGRPMRFIKTIEALGKQPTQCIRVAAPDHLYVTDDFIVTHNTLNDAFIILDEAQNTTAEQMKMFLTRMGFSSRMVVTGDITQVDLPKGTKSGLGEARRILTGIDGIRFVHFTESDVVRHPLVAKIVKAYDENA